MTASAIKTEMTAAELRKFGLVTGAILIGLIGCLLPWLHSGVETMLRWLAVCRPRGRRADRVGPGTPRQPDLLLQAVDEIGRRLWALSTPALSLFILFYGLFMPMGVRHAPVWQRPHAPPAQRRAGQLPRDPQQSRPSTHGEALLMLELLKDFAGFMKERKKYWLAPIVIVLLLLGLLIVFAHGSAVAPFIYTLF
jgi:hypothetical protein